MRLAINFSNAGEPRGSCNTNDRGGEVPQMSSSGCRGDTEPDRSSKRPRCPGRATVHRACSRGSLSEPGVGIRAMPVR
jgi:hypothetical protein